MKYKRWRFLILSAVVASITVVAIWLNVEPEYPGEVEARELDFPHMTSSTERMSEYADVFVFGRVAEVAATGIDKGPNNDGFPTAYTLYRLDVWETLKGDAPDSVYVFQLTQASFPTIH